MKRRKQRLMLAHQQTKDLISLNFAMLLVMAEQHAQQSSQSNQLTVKTENQPVELTPKQAADLFSFGIATLNLAAHHPELAASILAFVTDKNKTT